MTLERSQGPVSVVVPCFNHEAFVEEALDSVVRQTYEDLELIVLDDASHDATPALVERFIRSPAVRRRFRDRIVFEVLAGNRGAHAALNLGIGRASGPVISILNSDDRYPPERITVLSDALTAPDVVLAFGAVRLIDASGRDVTEDDWRGAALHQAQCSVDRQPSVGFALLRYNVAISTGNLLFRRTLFERVGGFRPLRYCHDWDFALRSLLIAEPRRVPDVTYDYRLHPTNAFRSLGDLAAEESDAVLRTYFSRIIREDYDNPAAPGPRTWPGVFEIWLEGTGFATFWQRALRSPE